MESKKHQAMNKPRSLTERRRWVPKAQWPALAPGDVRLLSGGNPQIARGDGPGPVLDYIAAMPGWKREIGELIDRLVSVTCPDARRAVRWNAPFWGMPGQGWMLSLGCLNRYVKVAFLNGADLVPAPPVASKSTRVRYLHLTEADRPDEDQIFDWLQQAARLPGDPLF